MHFCLGLFVIFAVWKWGDWRNWKKYHTTMMYFALGNLLYNFLTANHFLWKLKPDFFPNHSITEMVYTFITFPGSALLFLSLYPVAVKAKIRHYAKWYAVYVGMELIFVITDRIIYQYGWNFFWSVAFDLVMFPMLYLHHKRPLLAYGISMVIAIVLVQYFDIPVDVPIELRK